MSAPVAAVLFCALATGATVFQLALALGAPWGELAMGGRFPGRLPTALRAGAVVQGLVLVSLAGVVVSRAGVGFERWQTTARWAVWLAVASSALSLLANLVTPSARERRLWAPVALGMLLSSVVVALRG